MQIWLTLQRTSPQRAAAALKASAHREEDLVTDADVAAESAAMQSRCKEWVSRQSKLQDPTKVSQPTKSFFNKHVQGRSQLPQQMQGSWLQPHQQQGTLNGSQGISRQCQPKQGSLSQPDQGKMSGNSQVIFSHYAELDAGNGPVFKDAGHLHTSVLPMSKADALQTQGVLLSDGVTADKTLEQLEADLTGREIADDRYVLTS